MLEMARLHTVLRLAASVDEAMRVGRVAAWRPKRAVRSMRGGARARSGRSAGAVCWRREWGGRALSRIGSTRTGSTLTLDDLAFAVGTGGLGATREQASEATVR